MQCTAEKRQTFGPYASTPPRPYRPYRSTPLDYSKSSPPVATATRHYRASDRPTAPHLHRLRTAIASSIHHSQHCTPIHPRPHPPPPAVWLNPPRQHPRTATIVLSLTRTLTLYILYTFPPLPVYTVFAATVPTDHGSYTHYYYYTCIYTIARRARARV